MTIAQKLDQFYTENNLAENGGENEDFFSLHFKYFSLKLPNSDFRKKIVYIHDIQHILFDCDTTWKGEAYIAGWEIATGMWKHFSIGIMSIWAMGFSFLIHPKEVINGYKKGLKYYGLIDQNVSKESIMNLSLDHVNKLLLKDKPSDFSKTKLIIWLTIALFFFFGPFILLIALSTIFLVY
ncbi:hypothetical protein [Tenacibaculum jejuense]|uniref:Uncharacterized protein n=1 Tax=Tenacibaculum jejuense TaxID=584609 RepID=A0A238U6P8_9FLAO|nr:hypothetical protein [Tenacibaculum jejuense]SNR14827.1 conserved protein of unknown function [Tenacibaculum jejuense]